MGLSIHSARLEPNLTTYNSHHQQTFLIASTTKPSSCLSPPAISARSSLPSSSPLWVSSSSVAAVLISSSTSSSLSSVTSPVSFTPCTGHDASPPEMTCGPPVAGAWQMISFAYSTRRHPADIPVVLALVTPICFAHDTTRSVHANCHRV